MSHNLEQANKLTRGKLLINDSTVMPQSSTFCWAGSSTCQCDSSSASFLMLKAKKHNKLELSAHFVFHTGPSNSPNTHNNPCEHFPGYYFSPVTCASSDQRWLWFASGSGVLLNFDALVIYSLQLGQKKETEVEEVVAVLRDGGGEDG